MTTSFQIIASQLSKDLIVKKGMYLAKEKKKQAYTMLHFKTSLIKYDCGKNVHISTGLTTAEAAIYSFYLPTGARESLKTISHCLFILLSSLPGMYSEMELNRPKAQSANHCPEPWICSQHEPTYRYLLTLTYCRAGARSA